MSDELYDELSDLFNRIGFGGRKGPEMRALLSYLFDEDEARTALSLSPFAPESPQKVAERMGEDPGIMAERLDQMADKGHCFLPLPILITSRDLQGAWIYKCLVVRVLLPGATAV